MEGRLKEREEIATGTLLATFEWSPIPPSFIPGQFIAIKMRQLLYEDERAGRRFFSIIYDPNNNSTFSFATRISESGFKKTLADMPLGTIVDVGPIAGKFILPEDTSRPLVFIAGGIGITPFISLLRFSEQNKLPHHIKLIYSNHDQKSTAFFQELQDMAKRNPNISVVFSMTQEDNWQGEKRRVDGQMVKDYIKDLQTPLFYTAGPPAMVSVIVEVLKGIGISDDHIKSENFTGY